VVERRGAKQYALGVARLTAMRRGFTSLGWLVLCISLVTLGVDAAPSAAACQNEESPGFRAYLPACGSYELASPPFKSGNAIQQVSALSIDGSRAIVGAVGAFAGTESDVFGAKYEFSRTSTGWATSAINPPASVFSATDPKVFAASIDLNRTLWALRHPYQSTHARDLYIRNADGEFSEIGPTAPPSAAEGPAAGGSQEFAEFYSYAGASGDLSHILFSAVSVGTFSQPWPGDTTILRGASLYEYVGLGNTHPVLVGVSDGHTIVDKETLTSGRLISDCSTYLGSTTNEDDYNAVSLSGDKVFFTAKGSPECQEAGTAPEVNELYARIDNLETVPISEPRESQCGECQTATRSNAIFQGASEDGSKVFFLTEQELLPGAEGKNLYEYDFVNRASKKIVRVSTGSAKPEVLGVSRVSEDGSHVYFVARGALTAANKEGNEPTEGEPNLYVFERDATFPAGRLAFVGTLSEEDSQDWSEADERPVQATTDGRYVVFESVAPLTPGDTSVLPQVFEYDATEERLARVSNGQAGYADGQASADEHGAAINVQEYSRLGGFKPGRRLTALAVSADGSAVLFRSSGALTPLALEASEAGAESIYEYRSSGAIADGDTFLISDGKNKLTPQGNPAGLTPDGINAFFLSIDQILPQDGDQQFDLYDARSGGGFPALPASPACAGESCQGAPSSQPLLAAGPTLSVPGTPNPPSPPPPLAPEVIKAKVKAKAKAPTRAQRLAKAIKACRRKKAKQRSSCEKQARKRYGAKKAAKKKGHR
jgi:hypothetical protein